MKKIILAILIITAFIFIKCTSVEEISLQDEFLLKSDVFITNIDSFKSEFKLLASTKVESTIIYSSDSTISMEFNKNFAVIPFREENVNEIYNYVKNTYGSRFENYN